MKHIRRGKESLRRSGIMGIAMGIAFFCIAVGFSIAADTIIFLIFGLCFAVTLIGIGIHSLRQAENPDRPSLYEITDEPENKKPQQGENKFCPYCGTKVAGDYAYCNSCGKKLP